MKRLISIPILLLVIAGISFAQEVGGLRLGMTTSEMRDVLVPDGFDPPICNRYKTDPYYTCVAASESDGRLLTFQLSLEDKTLIQASLFFSTNRLAEIKQDTVKHFGRPRIEGSKFVWFVGGAIPARLELYNIQGKTRLSLSER